MVVQVQAHRVADPRHLTADPRLLIAGLRLPIVARHTASLLLLMDGVLHRTTARPTKARRTAARHTAARRTVNPRLHMDGISAALHRLHHLSATLRIVSLRHLLHMDGI